MMSIVRSVDDVPIGPFGIWHDRETGEWVIVHRPLRTELTRITDQYPAHRNCALRYVKRLNEEARDE